MIKPMKNVLFATNFSAECLAAFEYAAAIAVRFEATLVMLHVVDKTPEYIEGRLKGLLGEGKWQAMIDAHVASARQRLIGKQSTNAIVQMALSQFCADAGIDDDSCGYHSREIVVTDGEVVESIVKTAQDYDCSLIIMGTKEGFLSNNTIGSVIKGVMRQANMPVMVVPPTNQ